MVVRKIAVRNGHCAKCGKKLEYGGILCRECYGKDKNRWKNIGKGVKIIGR